MRIGGWIIFALITLLCSLAGLLAAFLFSWQAAERHFQRAITAQAQLAAVSAIEIEVATGGSRGAVADAIAGYRQLIRQETMLLATSAEHHAQTNEAAAGERLGVLAIDPSRRAEFFHLVGTIAARERAEVIEVGSAMRALRIRITILAGLLVAIALGAIAAGVISFAGTNRRLSRLVAIRTRALEEVDRSRRLFFAKCSHELRTPITVMRGEAEVALSDGSASTHDLRESLRHVVANAAFLGRRVDELLALSKADDGRLHLRHAPTDLDDVLDSVVGASTPYARSAEVGIDLMRDRTGRSCLADARWLGQAFSAIIDNAVKFSPAGGVVRVTAVGDPQTVTISVTDRGPGLTADELPRLFDAYYQTELGRSRGGTGLGLALARWVVEQHGGTIMAANVIGGGCRITVMLPLLRREADGPRLEVAA